MFHMLVILDRGGSNLGNSHKNRPRDVIHMMSPDQPRPKPRPRSPVGDPRDVIHMMSPDQPRPKPRTWNIKSPVSKTRKMNP